MRIYSRGGERGIIVACGVIIMKHGDEQIRPYFSMKVKYKNKLQTYLINNGGGLVSEYILETIFNRMVKDKIISESDKNDFFEK